MKTRNLFCLTGYLTLLTMIAWACSPSVEEYSGPEKNKALYGPQKHVYEHPEVDGIVYYVAPDGLAGTEGTSIDSPSTIESVLTRVKTGDAIVLRGGVYRTGNLTFNQGITLQPYADEQPVLKGTLVAANWTQVREGLWMTKWPHLFPAGPENWWNRKKEEQYTPLHRFNNDGVFIDGKFLQSVGDQQSVSAETFFVDYLAGEIFIGTDPADKLVEITAFRKAIVRTTGEVNGKASDGRGPVIRGLTITQYPDTMVHIEGYYPQGISPEEQNGKDVIGTVFENCTFSSCFRIGVFAISDSLVMRHCKIVDSNTEGLYLVASSDVLLEWNVFENNNIEKWTGFFPSAVKIFNQTHRVVCRNNLIINHPNSNGLWYDVGNRDGLFINNWVEKVGDIEKNRLNPKVWASYSGFFYEISSQAVCAGNVFLNNAQGIFVLNSAAVQVYNNTLINSTVSFGRDSRGDETDHFGWHILTGPGVDVRENHVFMNNLIYTDARHFRPAVVVWQPEKLCERLKRSPLRAMNNNLYLNEAAERDTALITWSPIENESCSVSLFSPEELTALQPEFANRSCYVAGRSPVIFSDFEHHNFHLKADVAGLGHPAELPDSVLKIMGWPSKMSSFIGAYPIK